MSYRGRFMKRLGRRKNAVIVSLAVLAAIVAASFLSGGEEPERLSLNRYTQLLEERRIATAEILDGEGTVKGETKDGVAYEVFYPAEFADEVTDRLLAAEVDVESKPRGGNVWLGLIFNILPIVLVFGLILFALNALQGGGNKVMQFGKAKPRVMSKDQPKTTFADVAGADEAVAELQEIKDFLASPERFSAIGAKVPKGVLLYGPPGTGKTLLARAVAGEAGVPFFSISGSDFVEMFVGVGASRVRDLFEQAKTSAPAIIFMDEIDAVGRHRGAGLGGGHDEREQTLNQLLVEMDGFDAHTGVILIAATNRPDILDPALLRPGRFDRQIVVDRPDLEGRKGILAVHAKDKPLTSSVDLSVLARRTPGFTGADLANLMNEAALLAAREDRRQIGMRELEEAIDRVLAGPERKTRVMSERERLVIAYHEGGHALVGHVLPGADPIHKMSIIARGRALGWTLSLPTEDKYLVRRSELKDQLAMALGGRSAEELIFTDPTTGAMDDIEKATRIARAMVTEYGMSDQLGPQALGQREGEPFLGRDINHTPNYSDEVATSIDAEVRRLIDEAHDLARDILTTHRATLDELAAALMEHETLDTPDLMAIIGHLGPWPATAPVNRPRRAPSRTRVKAQEQVAATSKREAAEATPARRGRQPRRVPRTGPAPA
jgi:cell division protease FtsH